MKTLRPLRLATLCTFSTIMATAMVPEVATAQPVRGRSISVSDDGNGRQIIVRTTYDSALIAQPDVTLRDIDLFEIMLGLSDAQRDAMKPKIEYYGAQLRDLSETMRGKLEANAGGMMGVRAGDDDDGGDADANPMTTIVHDAMKAEGIDPARLEEGIGLQLGLGVDMEEGDTEPTLSVEVGFQPEDGVTLTDDERAAFERAAARAAEAIKGMDLADLGIGIGPGGPGGPGDEDVDGPVAVMDDLADVLEEADAERALIRAFQKDRVRLRLAFDADAKSLLSEEQIAAWPALDRALVRRHTLEQGELEGESVDLFALREAMKWDDATNAAVADVFAAYDVRLHEALTKRNAFVATANMKVDEELAKGDVRAAWRLREEGAERRVSVRDATFNATMQIVNALKAVSSGDDMGSDFRDAVRAAAHPRLFQDTAADRAFAAVAKDDRIADDTRTAAATMHDRYKAERDQLTRRIEATVRKADVERFLAGDLQLMGEFDEALAEKARRSRGKTPTMTEAMTPRADLDIRTMKALYAIMDPVIVADLPAIPEGATSDTISVRLGDDPWRDREGGPDTGY